MSRLIRWKLLMSRRYGAGRIAYAQNSSTIPRRVNSDRLAYGELRCSCATCANTTPAGVA